jgi:hypothetical protein
VKLPEPLPARSVALTGTIYVVDTANGKRISELPVRFERAGFPQAAGDCCAP